MDQQQPAVKDEAALSRVTEIIIRHLRAHNKWTRLQMLILVGLINLIWLIPGGTILRKLLPIGFLAAFPVIVFLISLRNPQRHKVLRLLRESPDDIVWVYIFKHRGGSRVMLGLLQGKMLGVATKPGSEQALLEAIASLTPRATVGFDPSYHAVFRKNPADLKRPG
jgi:hypothetical protein